LTVSKVGFIIVGCLPGGAADPDYSKLAATRTRSSLHRATKPERRKPMIGDDRERDKETRIPTWDLGRDIYYDSIAIGYNLILVTY
jgi:hypothetical protein